MDFRFSCAVGTVVISPALAAMLIAWRVEEEFINAIRGKEEITHTDFQTGVKYMEWTDSVALSIRHRKAINLPLTEG